VAAPKCTKALFYMLVFSDMYHLRAWDCEAGTDARMTKVELEPQGFVKFCREFGFGLASQWNEVHSDFDMMIMIVVRSTWPELSVGRWQCSCTKIDVDHTNHFLCKDTVDSRL